jgi:hypothetical protein
MGARPWQSHAEDLVDQALSNALEAPEAQIRRLRPLTGPQDPFPDRLGFRQESWTIEEVLNIDRRTPTHRSWMSGMPVEPSVMSDQSWSGSARNAFTEGVF